MKAASNLKNMPYAKETADLWIALRAPTLTAAIHALYYLPMNYRFLVLDAPDTQIDKEKATHPELMDRLQGMSSASAQAHMTFSHVIVAEQPENKHLLVRVSEPTDLEHAYLVAADNPAALASAIHEIARTTL
jgi:hypothetical protein